MSCPSPASFLRRGRWPAALAALALCLAGLHAATVDELARGFPRPPDAAKPQLWWHWMNGNISRDGIVKDLQAFRDAGFGAVILFEESDRIPEGPVRYLSEQHLDLIDFASAECARLGLEFGFQNCPGWSSSGGPWITEDQAMKHLTWSEQAVAGGHRVSVSLPRPSTRVRPLEQVGPPGRYQEGHDYYRDVTVLAFPTPAEPVWRLDQWQEKAGFRTARNQREQAGLAPAGAVIDPAKIVVLTEHVHPDGTLEWDAPPGAWTILRFGYTLTAHTNREAPTTGARGLESDKLSREATEFHWRNFVDRILAAASRSPGGRVDTVMIDSYEPLTQTWTPRMPEEFRRLRTYDLTRFLPCLTGRVVGDLRDTERFLWDYRRTLADLVAENYYAVFAEKCRQRGLKLALEGYGYYGTFFDEFANNLHADIPMGEFWAGVVKWHHWSGKLAASAADISGRHVVGAEAFTAGNDLAAWKWHPYTLKAQGDYFLCRGINRFYIQAGAHQPWADHIRPGMTLGPHGIQMNRNNTWFAPSRAWLAYQARSQFMLQHGRLVTDLYVDYGNNAPATIRPAARVTARGPKGVDWDVEADVAPDIGFALPAGRDFHVGHSRVRAIRRPLASASAGMSNVRELAVNDQDAGILWKPPFRRDITALLRPGANTVTIKETNLWRNRLVGDAIARNFTADDAARLADRMLSGETSSQIAHASTGGADDAYPVSDWVRRGAPNPEPGTYSFTVFPFVNTSTPLPPSGLVAPVRVLFGQRVPLR